MYLFIREEFRFLPIFGFSLPKIGEWNRIEEFYWTLHTCPEKKEQIKIYAVAFTAAAEPGGKRLAVCLIRGGRYFFVLGISGWRHERIYFMEDEKMVMPPHISSSQPPPVPKVRDSPKHN